MTTHEDCETEFNRLWEQLVPEKGEAATVQGEMVRAIGRLLRECEDNGNINWGEDDYYQQLTDFLEAHLCDVELFGEDGVREIKKALDEARVFENCDADALYYLQAGVVDWCMQHSDPIPRSGS